MSRYYPPVTVTGNPVNFSAPNGGKLDSVSVPIIPTQDLHGYANPWPAGGGVNKFDEEMVLGILNNNGTVSSSTTRLVSKNFIPITAETQYSMSWDKPGSSTARARGAFYDSTETFLSYVGDLGSTPTEENGRLVTQFTTPQDAAYLKICMYTSYGTTYKNDITIGLYNASTNGKYYPYSNICPISGRTGLSVYVGPTQDHDDATVYNVDWSAQAGTVYGGTDEIIGGSLESTYGMVDLGTLTWVADANRPGVFYGAIAGRKDSSGVVACSAYSIRNAGVSTSVDMYISGYQSYGGNRIFVRDTRFSGKTAAEFKAGVAGVQAVYELATPLTYQLTPQQIAALIDQNYIWSSNNETISVVYALLVPGSDKYTLIVNGVDIADFVERDSYRTTLYPVFSEAVQTLDGVGHTALLRKKGELSARFNPRTAADTAIICAALLNAPCEVQYHCLQRNADVTALMTIDSVSALYLSRCLYCRQKWNDIDSITLTEL